MTKRLFLLARSLLLGWAALLVGVYLVERPLLRLVGRLLDESWFATVRLALACSVLSATGWVVGRSSRPIPLVGALTFAVTLAFWFTATLGIAIPWLLRLFADAVRDPRYWGSLLDTAGQQALLFGSLIAGAILSREAPGKPLSIFPARPS